MHKTLSDLKTILLRREIVKTSVEDDVIDFYFKTTNNITYCLWINTQCSQMEYTPSEGYPSIHNSQS